MMRLFVMRMAWLVAPLLLAHTVCAQTTPATDDQATLHVYVNLVQIPVLVLNSSLHPMNRIPSDDFHVSIEGVGRIKPTRIRLQGDDPINLALIVDRSVRDDDLWNNLPKSLDPLIQALKPHDHVSVYAMDGCNARRVGMEMAPFQENDLRLSVKTVMDVKPFEENKRKKMVCEKPLTYWDMVNYAANRLAAVSGRKLIVTLGPGALLPRQKAMQIHDILISNSISLFPIVHGDGSSVNPNTTINMVSASRYAMSVAPAVTDMDSTAPLTASMQAERSGGMLLGTTFRSFAKTLAQPIVLARGRYIIEFPRPDALLAGQYHIAIADGHPRDFIRPAGISVPLADPKEKLAFAVAHGALTTPAATSTDNPVATAPLPQADSRQASAPRSSAAIPSQSAAEGVPSAATPASLPPPKPDPTDITRDLRPSH